jgi:hypothetical protein
MKKGRVVKIKSAKKTAPAEEADASADIQQDVKMFEESIRQPDAGQVPFDRLLVLYRKQKKYKDELRVVNKAIKTFSDRIEDLQSKTFSGRKDKRKLHELSLQFGKKSGLLDRKGNELHYPEPISRWLKRKKVIEKKLEKG